MSILFYDVCPCFAMIVLFVPLTVRYEWDGIKGGKHGCYEGRRGKGIVLILLLFVFAPAVYLGAGVTFCN